MWITFVKSFFFVELKKLGGVFSFSPSLPCPKEEKALKTPTTFDLKDPSPPLKFLAQTKRGRLFSYIIVKSECVWFFCFFCPFSSLEFHGNRKCRIQSEMRKSMFRDLYRASPHNKQVKRHTRRKSVSPPSHFGFPYIISVIVS